MPLSKRFVVTVFAVAAALITLWLVPVSSRAAATLTTPTINPSGTPQSGEQLTVTDATWSGGTAPDTVGAWQWEDCGSGGTNCSVVATGSGPGATYTLGASDVGHTIVFQETVTDSSTPTANSGPASSAPTAVVVAPLTDSAPKVSGTAQVGRTLSVTNGSPSGGTAPYGFVDQWEDCDSSGNNCSPNGATGQSYTLALSDVGHRIVVQETATDSSSPANSGTASSAATAVVVPAPLVNSSPPTISGSVQVGQTLNEKNGSWSGGTPPYSFAWQWQDCDSSGHNCVPVSGPNGQSQSYVLTSSDVGHTIVVQETATDSSTPANSKTASSAATPVVPPPPPPGTVASSVGLLASPSAPVTNQSVTIVAYVTSSDSTSSPSGTVTFENGKTAITGCINLPVVPGGQTVAVSCRTSFAAGAPQVTATFVPKAGLNMAGSSAVDGLTVGRDSSSTALDAPKTVNVGASTTYTATVSPSPSRPGPIEPTGSVVFFDGGKPIGSCLSQPLSNGGATCTVTYGARGSHSITAWYGGDANFTASFAPAQGVSVVPPASPGRITSTMHWSFYYTPTYTTVLSLVVNGASGATVSANCTGQGCPFAGVTMDPKTKSCRPKGTHGCAPSGIVDLTPKFRRHRLSVGSRIIIRITRQRWIGKYYVFTIMSRRGPRIRITCLAPGRMQPGARC